MCVMMIYLLIFLQLSSMSENILTPISWALHLLLIIITNPHLFDLMSKDLPTVMLTETPASNYSSNTFRPVKVMMMVRMMMVIVMVMVMVMVMVPPASNYSSYAFRSMKSKLISSRHGTSPQYQNRYLDLVVWYWYWYWYYLSAHPILYK